MSKGSDTREAILDAALAIASVEGLHGLTIGELAKEVDMSKSGLYAHFGSKEALQLQVLKTATRRFIDHVVAPALRAPRGEPRIRALFDHWIAWSDDDSMPGGCVFTNTANELDDRPGVLRDALVEAQRDWFSALTVAAGIAVEEGHFRADLDAEQFVYELYSILLAYHQFRRLLRDPKVDDRCRLAFERLLDRSRTEGSTQARSAETDDRATGHPPTGRSA